MLVRCALVNIQITQQFGTQTILGQHTLYYFTEQTVCALGQKVSRRIRDLSTGISGISQINTIVPLITSQNDFLCVDDNYVITTVNVRSEIGFVLTTQKLRYLCAKAT